MPARRTIYLDHSATTPVDPRVVAAMLPYFGEAYGNPSSSHSFGRKAEQAIESARETLAALLHCKPSEIVFTSGGSEGDNLALRGAAWAARTNGKGRHLVTSPVEHEAVSRTIDQMVDVMGFEQTVIPVDHWAAVHPDGFQAACKPETVVASIMYANNEVGTIEPIPALAQAAREKGVLFHTDAVQAVGQLSLNTEELGVDLLSLSAHKFYGPKGVGALYVRAGVDLVPSQSGGGHEDGRRAGTHNTPLIVGMAQALQIAYDEFDQHTAHYRRMRDRLIDSVLSDIPAAQLTGHANQRLPSHASFIFEGVESNILLAHLDLRGVAASSGSACKTGSPEPSGVLLAMGYSPREALSSLRLTVGRQTTEEEIDYTVEILREAVAKLTQLAVR